MKISDMMPVTTNVAGDRIKCAVCGETGALYEVWTEKGSVYLCKMHMDYKPLESSRNTTKYDNLDINSIVVDYDELKKIGYDDSEVESIALLKKEASRFIKNAVDHAGSNLVVFGYPGTGKTHAMYAVRNELRRHGLSPYMVLWGVFIQRIYEWQKGGDAPGLTHYMNNVAKSDALLIDDLMYMPDTGFAKHVATGMIDMAYMRGVPVMLTTNYSEEDLVRLIGAPSIDRLRERGVFLRLTHKSFRTKGGRR